MHGLAALVRPNRRMLGPKLRLAREYCITRKLLFQLETANKTELIYTRRLKPLAQILIQRFQQKA